MLNGTGVGHRMTMIAMLPSIFSMFEGPRSFVLGNLCIASSRDYDLIFVWFCQDTLHAYHGHFCKATSGITLGCKCASVFDLHALFILN